MSWLDSLEIPISEAIHRFPEHVGVASIPHQQQVFLVSLEALKNMERMHLEQLPVSAIALPYELSDILTRRHEETLVRNISHHLSDYFPNFFVAAIYELQSLFSAEEVNAYIIGGIVRDMLLSSERRFEIRDVDIIIEGQALAAAHYVNNLSKNFNLLQEFIPFGTAKLDYKNQIRFDFASTRREIYRGCGLLPEIVEQGVPLEEDIIRRDFTINALALSILHPGEIIDSCNGLKDLEARKIRLLKAASFFEDPTRILRMYRYATGLDFAPGEDTDLLLEQFIRWMPEVYKGGGDRIREELYKLLTMPESPTKIQWLGVLLEKGLHRLIDTHLPPRLDLPLPLEQISHRIQKLQERLADFWTPDLTWQVQITLLLLGLPKPFIQSAMHRIELTRHEIEVVEKSLLLLQENIMHSLTPFDSVTRLYDIFHTFPMGSACVGILLSSQFEIGLEALRKYKTELENVTLEVTGDDVLKLGVPQGEQVGELLRTLLQAKLQGKVHHRLEEINWLKTQITAQTEEKRS